MIKKIINTFKELEPITYKIMKYGLTFCFGICIISIVLLVTYNLTLLTPNLYYIGLSCFKFSCVFGVEFIICGLIVDNIKKQMI